MTENIIEIKELSKDYETGFWRKRSVRALDGLTLNIKPGGIFGFLGGNGAGKTTTIKILMGLLFPTSGSASILGNDISLVEMHHEIGYCPENPYFYDYLTANELMDYFGQIFEFDQTTRRLRSDELLTAVGLDEKDRNRQLRKFSKGMLQRVGLAQSLINDPKIVFMDEPMSGLDPIGRREIRELIAGLRTKGTTVFMSTHILSDVEALCDNVAILRKGKLAATGTLNELLDEQGGRQSFEILLTNISLDDLRRDLDIKEPIDFNENPSGILVRVDDENAVENVLAAARVNGGKLVSVNAVKRSLEELFVQETAE